MTHAGGRPPLYTTVDELETVVDEYFDVCDNRIQHVYDKKSGSVIEIINPEPYTMSGLAYAIGMDRRTLLEYGKKEQFSLTIKRAREKVHLDVERRLMEGNSTGAIFNLKNNFDWKDKTEQDITSKGESITVASTELASNFADYLKKSTKES